MIVYPCRKGKATPRKGTRRSSAYVRPAKTHESRGENPTDRTGKPTARRARGHERWGRKRAKNPAEPRGQGRPTDTINPGQMPRVLLYCSGLTFFDLSPGPAELVRYRTIGTRKQRGGLTCPPLKAVFSGGPPLARAGAL
jgi:hypothetical protein